MLLRPLRVLTGQDRNSILAHPGPSSIRLDSPKSKPDAAERPQFAMPHLEVPAALRAFTDMGATQAKQNLEKIKIASQEATDLLEDAYSMFTKGATGYGLKVIEWIATPSS